MVDFLKELAIELGVELFSIGTLKKFITKTMAQKVITGQEPVETHAKNANGEDVDIKFGGTYNLTDEEAYIILMAKLETSPDGSTNKLAAKVSENINKELPQEDQKKRFRIVFGRLSQIEYTKEINKERKEIPQAKGAPKIEEKSREVTVNLAVELLRSFVNYTPQERKGVYEAMGIMSSELQRNFKSAKKSMRKNKGALIGAMEATSRAILDKPYEGPWAEMKKTLWPFTWPFSKKP